MGWGVRPVDIIKVNPNLSFTSSGVYLKTRLSFIFSSSGFPCAYSLSSLLRRSGCCSTWADGSLEAINRELCRPQPSVAQQQEIEDFWQNTWFGQRSEGLGGEKRRKNPLICPGFAAHQLFGRTITAALLFSASCAEALGNSWSMAGPEALYYTFRVFWDCLKAASWLHMLRMQNTLRREAGQMLNSQLSTWRSSWDMTSRHR